LDITVLKKFEAAAGEGSRGCIIKDGYLVYAWGDQQEHGEWASASKPLYSTLLFFALQERKLNSVDDLVNPYVEQALGKSFNEKDSPMTFRHLANMTGNYTLPEAPGAAYGYNDFNIALYLKALLEGVYGVKTTDLAGLNQLVSQRLDELQFEDGAFFMLTKGYPRVNLSVRDAARLGWFWLHKGNWGGQQLLDSVFFKKFCQPQVPATLPVSKGDDLKNWVDPPEDYLGIHSMGGGNNQTEAGPGTYGFNWWFNGQVASGRTAMPDVPQEIFWANGHSRKFIISMPSYDLVAVSYGQKDHEINFSPKDDYRQMNDFLSLLNQSVQPEKTLPGQIIVNPLAPQWLVHNQDEDQDGRLDPFFVCGPGDPEDFLYLGTRNPDGTRAGDQAQRINKLIEHGGNSIYMQIVRTHGGDAGEDQTHNPFVDSDPAKGLDEDILNQWETWFTLMDQHDILIYLFFYDDGAMIWDNGDQAGPEEQVFVETIVRKFMHHRNLIWLIGEESEERYTAKRVQAIAEIIRNADEHDHIIGNHHLSGTTFKAWQPGSALSHYSMQYNETGENVHAGAIEARQKAAGNYQVIYSENTAMPTNVDGMRRHTWAAAMGGTMPMLLHMDIANTPVEALNQCRYLQLFFEATDYYTMTPQDELKHGGTKYVLARPGYSYIAYTDTLSHAPGIKDLPAGRYALTWMDCKKGKTTTMEQILSETGDHSFDRPEEIGHECVVWIERTKD